MLAEAARAATSTVVAALQRASDATGVDFRYLLGTAMRESGLQPQARSSHSTATGLFQFVEQTWFSVMKEFGAKHGLGSFANVIQKGEDGRFHASDAQDRQAILRLRNDPQISAIMAGEYARKTQATMESRLGRAVCGGELYAGHLLGPGAACKLIRTSETSPNTSAADLFPKAAGANRSVFFNADGSAKTVREVYNWTVAQPNTTAPLTAAAAPASAPAASNITPAMALIDTNNTAELFASMWGPQRRGFFSSDSTPSQPFALTPAILDILSTFGKSDVAPVAPPPVAKLRGTS
jgi:hypothetical protein